MSKLLGKNYAPIIRYLFTYLNSFAEIGKSDEQKITAQLWGFYMLTYYVLSAEGDVGSATQAIDYADAIAVDVAALGEK